MDRYTTRGEKRSLQREEEDEEEKEENPSASKKPKVPALASVIVEALKLDSMQRLCSSLEPLLRRIVSEEVERALTKLGQPTLAASSSPQRIGGPGGRKLQLHFRSRLPAHLFTGGKVEGEHGTPIHVVLLDALTGVVVPSGPESTAKLRVVVLEGDFNEEADDEWTEEQFGSFEVKEREGKRPLLNGDLQVTLKGGVGTLGDLTFTDNSSWIRSRKFRLGVKVADGLREGVRIRIREAKTEAFTVKDHRGELYKKHYPPALHDEVWRLDRIAKDGALHKKLVGASIVSVEDFLRLLVRDQRKLRSILGSGMSNRMWENTVEHAKTCILGGKLYVYFSDETRETGAAFNHIYELRGLIANGQFQNVESLSHDQKISVDILVKRAYDNWNHVVEYDGQSLKPHSRQGITDYSSTTEQYYSPDNPDNPDHVHDSSVELALGDWPRARDDRRFEDYFSEEEIRMRGSELLEHDDMQHMLRSFTSGVGAGDFGSSSEASYSYDVPRSEFAFGQERSRSRAKAGVSWLKLKAAFRWGIFVRKRAAERRRARLLELD